MSSPTLQTINKRTFSNLVVSRISHPMNDPSSLLPEHLSNPYDSYSHVCSSNVVCVRKSVTHPVHLKSYSYQFRHRLNVSQPQTPHQSAIRSTKCKDRNIKNTESTICKSKLVAKSNSPVRATRKTTPTMNVQNDRVYYNVLPVDDCKSLNKSNTQPIIYPSKSVTLNRNEGACCIKPVYAVNNDISGKNCSDKINRFDISKRFLIYFFIICELLLLYLIFQSIIFGGFAKDNQFGLSQFHYNDCRTMKRSFNSCTWTYSSISSYDKALNENVNPIMAGFNSGEQMCFFWQDHILSNMKQNYFIKQPKGKVISF